MGWGLKNKNFNITGVYWKNPSFRGIGFTKTNIYIVGKLPTLIKKINQYLTNINQCLANIVKI